MLRHTARIAELASNQISNCDYVVATDDTRIKEHCEAHELNFVMTADTLKTGSDRALAAADVMPKTYDFVVNLQGDAPFTPVDSIVALAETIEHTRADVATPYIQLSWDDLDTLREHKQSTPFSGTTVAVSENGYALWFSKNIIPGIRKESELRESTKLSPIKRHIGLYAFSYEALKRFTTYPESQYETLEGLEQLRLLENGMNIACVSVSPPKVSTSGIDSPADIDIAEALIAKHGDPFK
jgi:3-deoxy-manno-octulosonate cytidylyltransferase (CMP-KDO synthetase)